MQRLEFARGFIRKKLLETYGGWVFSGNSHSAGKGQASIKVKFNKKSEIFVIFQKKKIKKIKKNNKKLEILIIFQKYIKK